jgi:tetratricopeptide (TPR) repeat protein
MFRIFSFIIFIAGASFALFNFRPQIVKFFTPKTTVEIPVKKSSQPNLSNLTFAQLLSRGEQFRAGGFLNFAIQNFAAAVQIAPTEKTAHQNLIETQIEMRDFSSALAATQSALQIFKNDPDFLLAAGRIFLHQLKLKSAQKAFAKISQHPQKNFYLGICAAADNDFVTAKKFLNSAKKEKITEYRSKKVLRAFDEFALFPDGDELHLQLLLAKSFNELGIFELAAESAKKVVAENEKYIDAHLVLGQAYFELGKFIFAENSFQNALKIDPTKPETLFFLGLCAEKKKDFPAAIEFVEKALANGFSPRDEAKKKIANLNLQNGKIAAAVENLEGVLAENSEVENFEQIVFVLLEFAGAREKALNFAARAVEKFPTSARAKNLFGWANLENGNLNAAKKAIADALALDSKLAAAHLNLGKILQIENRTDAALEKFRTAAELAGERSEVGKLAAQKIAELLDEI